MDGGDLDGGGYFRQGRTAEEGGLLMKQSPEPIILAAALALLLLGAAALAYLYPDVPTITGVTSLDPKGDKAKPLNGADIVASFVPWTTPAIWKQPDTGSRLFDSAKYLFYASAYPNADYIKKMDALTISPSGVLLSWYTAHGLDFEDPNVDREDTDGDGFSNIVEYKNDPVGVRRKAADVDGSKSTDPSDPKSHPDYLARLRLQKFETRPFHVQFKGYNQVNGEYLFQLHLSDVQSDKQPAMLKSGDQLGFEGYVVGAFHEIEKEEMDPATKTSFTKDESTLELDKPEINVKVIVPFRTEIDSPEYTAVFVMLMPTEVDKAIKISRGKIFTVPYIPDRSFLVLSADDNGATIRDTKTKEEFTIPKLISDTTTGASEWDEVPLPPAAPASAPHTP
jgi:hypothetical protein